jgi:hypothetical protein
VPRHVDPAVLGHLRSNPSARLECEPQAALLGTDEDSRLVPPPTPGSLGTRSGPQWKLGGAHKSVRIQIYFSMRTFTPVSSFGTWVRTERGTSADFALALAYGVRPEVVRPKVHRSLDPTASR